MTPMTIPAMAPGRLLLVLGVSSDPVEAEALVGAGVSVVDDGPAAFVWLEVVASVSVVVLLLLFVFVPVSPSAVTVV